VAICGITGSTARVNKVEANTTRATIFRTGGMAEARLLILDCWFWL
jgi:hypothetical protein